MTRKETIYTVTELEPGIFRIGKKGGESVFDDPFVCDLFIGIQPDDSAQTF